jgi:class 3 adenylate cyclase
VTLTAEEPGWESTSHSFDAVVGFVDLAGFTACADALSRSGPAGTEELVSLINALFGPAIDCIHAAGGEVGWFAGDAMGVLFDTSVTPPMQALRSLIDASACIAGVQPLIVDGELITMTAKIGIAAGLVDWQWVGSEFGADERVGWFGGNAIDASAAAEHFATAGDVIADASFVRLAPIVGEQLPDGFVRIDKHSITVESAIGSSGVSPVLSLRRDEAFHPSRVARLARTAGLPAITEHRTITAMFIGVPDPRHDAASVAHIRHVVEIQGGHINAATEGDKGANFMAVFGAPMAQPERADRAVICATQIRDAFPTVRIGIASGRVFAGPIGNAARWDYATIGDRVNVAARLMQAAAPGEIFIDASTFASMRRQLDVGTTTLLALKGKTAPEEAIPVRGLGVRRDSVLLGATASPFVGRARERAELTQRFGGSDSFVCIRGEAGSGKSRLLDQFILSYESAGFAIAWLEQADIDRPFSLWQRLCRRLCPAHVSLEEFIADTFTDAERLGVLNQVLGVDFTETALTQPLAVRDRLEIAATLLEELLPKLADGRSIAIEDLHWSDDRSLELLRKLVPRLRGTVRMLVTSRPEERTVIAVTGATTVTVDDLAADEVASLITDRWRSTFGRNPDPSLVESIALRSAGSPLFVEQIIALALDTGVAADARIWPVHISFPLTVRDVVISRLERLPDAANIVTGWAAVIGRTFSSHDLFTAFDELDRETAETGLAGLVANGIVVTGELNHFHHALFAEASYDRLPFERRRKLHRSMLSYLEASVADPTTQASNFARHAEHGGRRPQQFRYFRVAADQARSAYANPVALNWYQLLLRAMLDDGTKAAAEIGAVHRLIGQVHAGAGDFNPASVAFSSAADLLTSGDCVDVLIEKGESLARGGDAKTAYALFEQLEAEVSELQDWVRLYRVLDTHANMATRLADVERATRIEQRYEDLATDDRSSAAFQVPLEGLVHLPRLRGDLATTEQRLRDGYDLAVRTGDLAKAARWASSLAGIAFESHRLTECSRHLKRSSELFQLVGDRSTMLQLVTGNAARLLESIGDPGTLRAGIVTIEEAVRLGDARSMAIGCRVIGTAKNSDHWLRRAALLSEACGDQESLVEAAFWIARLSAKHDLPRSSFLFHTLVSMRPKNVLAQVEMLRSDISLGLAPTEAIRRVGALKNQKRSAHDAALLDAVHAEIAADLNLAERAVETCRSAFEQFPSAELRTALERLDGFRGLSMPSVQTIEFTSLPTRALEDLAADVDTYLQISDANILRSRAESILDQLIIKNAQFAGVVSPS